VKNFPPKVTGAGRAGESYFETEDVILDQRDLARYLWQRLYGSEASSTSAASCSRGTQPGRRWGRTLRDNRRCAGYGKL